MSSKSLLITALYLLFFSQVLAQKVKFEKGGWKEVLEKSKKLNKPIFVDFYATWCGPCKQLDSEVYTDKKVAAFMNKNYINVKIDAEKEELELVKINEVEAYPTLVYFNNLGDIVAKTTGFLDSEEFLDFAKEALEESKLPSLASLEKEYNAGRRDTDFLKNYLQKRYYFNPERTDNNLLLDEYINAKVSNLNYDSEVAEQVYQQLKSIRINSEAYKYFVLNKKQFKDLVQDEKLQDDETFINAYNTYFAYNSIAEAVRLKNQNLILKESDTFIRYCEKSKYYFIDPQYSVNQLCFYYFEKKDIKTYFDYSKKYLDSRYGKIKNTKDTPLIFNDLFEYNLKNSSKPDSLNITKNETALSYLNASLAEDINNVVWRFFEINKEPLYLNELLPYIKLAVELSPTYYNIDTYAQLLDNTGSKQQALWEQKKAIRLAKFFNTESEYAPLEETLAKMQETFKLAEIKPVSLNKESLFSHLEAYKHYNLLLDFDKILDFMPSLLFDKFPRTLVKKSLEGAFNMDDIFIEMSAVDFKSNKDLILNNNKAFTILDMFIKMKINVSKMITEDDAEKNTAFINTLQNTYEAMYGKANVNYEKVEKAFYIKSKTEAFAVGEANEATWKFMNNDDKYKGLISELIPENILEKLKK